MPPLLRTGEPTSSNHQTQSPLDASLTMTVETALGVSQMVASDLEERFRAREDADRGRCGV